MFQRSIYLETGEEGHSSPCPRLESPLFLAAETHFWLQKHISDSTVRFKSVDCVFGFFFFF